MAGLIVSLAALVALLLIRSYKRPSDFQVAVSSYILVVFTFLCAIIVNQWQTISSLCGEAKAKTIFGIDGVDNIVASLLLLTCSLLPIVCMIVAYDAHVTRRQLRRTHATHQELLAENVNLGQDMLHLMERANAPIFGVDEYGCVNEWNDKAEAVMGYSREDVLGKGFVHHLVEAEQRESVRCMLERALAGEEEPSNFELTVCSRDGPSVEILLNITTRHDGKGHIVGVVGIGQDVTALKAEQAERAEIKECEAANRAQEELMAYLFHDMRNDLNALVGFCDEVGEAVNAGSMTLTPSVALAFADSHAHGRHGAQVITNMLDFTKLRTGKLALPSLPICISSVLRESVSLSSCLIRNKPVELSLSLPDEWSGSKPVVFGSQYHLMAVLLNLLSNVWPIVDLRENEKGL